MARRAAARAPARPAAPAAAPAPAPPPAAPRTSSPTPTPRLASLALVVLFGLGGVLAADTLAAADDGGPVALRRALAASVPSLALLAARGLNIIPPTMPLGAVAAAAASVALIGAAASGAAGGPPAPPAALPSVTVPLAAVNDALGGDSLALNGVKQLAAAWSAGAARADAGPAASLVVIGDAAGTALPALAALRGAVPASAFLEVDAHACGVRSGGCGERIETFLAEGSAAGRPSLVHLSYVEAITTSAAARETFGVLERLIEATLAQPVPTDGGGAIRASLHAIVLSSSHLSPARCAELHAATGGGASALRGELRRLWSSEHFSTSVNRSAIAFVNRVGARYVLRCAS